MIRRLTILAAVLSLLMGFGVGGLWVRSYSVADVLSYRPGQQPRTYHVFHSRGDLAMSRMDALDYGLRPEQFKRWNLSLYNMYADWGTRQTFFHRWGFAMHGSLPSAPGGAILVPYWFVVILTAVLPVLVTVQMWRRRGQDARKPA